MAKNKSTTVFKKYNCKNGSVIISPAKNPCEPAASKPKAKRADKPAIKSAPATKAKPITKSTPKSAPRAAKATVPNKKPTGVKPAAIKAKPAPKPSAKPMPKSAKHAAPKRKPSQTVKPAKAQNTAKNTAPTASETKIGKLDVYTELPVGWQVDRFALTAPRGYQMINNGKGLFSGERHTALLKM